MPDMAGTSAERPAHLLDLADESATLALGAALAGHLRRGDMLALYGDLGTGKTCLARGLLRRLGHAGEVPSPTFTLVQSYELTPAPVRHFDLYRIADPSELVELGWDEARTDGIVIVEWPERLGPQLPVDRLDIELSYRAETDGGQDGRTARLTGHGAWQARLDAFADAL